MCQVCQTSHHLTFMADIGNEDLRAQIKSLQYEVDSLKHDREVVNLRHERELREAQTKAEEVLHKARVGAYLNL